MVAYTGNDYSGGTSATCFEDDYDTATVTYDTTPRYRACHINLIRSDEPVTEEELDKMLAKAENDHDSRWVQREGKRLNLKCPNYPFIAKHFIRKMIPCNRRGVGLHLKKRNN